MVTVHSCHECLDVNQWDWPSASCLMQNPCQLVRCEPPGQREQQPWEPDGWYTSHHVQIPALEVAGDADADTVDMARLATPDDFNPAITPP